MSFEVGRLSAALTLDGVPEFHRGLDEAGRKLTETGKAGTAFGRAGEAAVRATAGATTGLVSAAGAYLAILTKTGVGYNSLQQNSRAALKVLLGGTEQANAQMSKLDDFARNSPFSKSVFISAQQQLLGFGLEAAKVVPTLDAVQQSVAAMGGSNEQISEVVNILANVQSTGKITAETLNQLGYRGLDAATLIGSSMGKSGNEIREAITKGTLGGEEALDALVSAMDTKFAGAADGVKEQWSGAVDRIKAANRDLGAHIAEPFVSAQGGGMAVTWGNQVADVLRAIEKQAIPVMGILTQRGMPFFASLTQGLDSARMSIQRWDASTLEQSLDKLGNHAPGIAALAGATLALGTQVGPLATVFKTLHLTANPVVAALAGIAMASPEVRSSLMGVLQAGKPLIPVVGDLAKALSGTLNAALPLVADGVDLAAGALKVLVGLIEKVPAPVIAGGLAFLAFHKATGALEGPIGKLTGALSGLWSEFKGASEIRSFGSSTLGGIGSDAANLGGAFDVASGKVVGLGNAIKGAFLSNPIGIALTVVSAAIGIWATANANAQQKVQEHQARVSELKGTLDEATGALTAASSEMLAQSVASDDMAEKLNKAGVSGVAFVSGLTKGAEASKMFRGDLVKQAETMVHSEKQLEGARDMAQRLGLSYETVVESLLGFGEASEKVDGAVKASGASYLDNATRLDSLKGLWKGQALEQRDVVAAYEEQRTAIADAQAEQQRYNDAVRDSAASMTDAARSNQRFNDALSVARDTTQDAETRVRALKQALDELKGGAISAEQAQINLTRTAESLAEGFSRTDENGRKLWQSTLDGAGKISVATGAGADFAEQMRNAGTGMLDAARAASDKALADGDLAGAMKAATTAGEQHIARLQDEMKQAGLTSEQIAGLTKEYFDVPSLVATLLTDNNSISEVDQKLIQLAAQINATPNKTVTVSEPMSPEIIKRLEALNYRVTTLSNGNVQITETGAASVENTLAALTRERTATVRVVEVNGGSSPLSHGRTNGATAFATGGMASGFYKAPPGQPALHKFAEQELPWEAYISPKPGYRDRNIAIAMESLNRLAFPVVPASQVYGTRAFARGDMLANRSNATPAQPLRAVPARPGRDAPLVGTVNLGQGVTRDQFAELQKMLDFYERGGR